MYIPNYKRLFLESTESDIIHTVAFVYATPTRTSMKIRPFRTVLKLNSQLSTSHQEFPT